MKKNFRCIFILIYFSIYLPLTIYRIASLPFFNAHLFKSGSLALQAFIYLAEKSKIHNINSFSCFIEIDNLFMIPINWVVGIWYQDTLKRNNQISKQFSLSYSGIKNLFNTYTFPIEFLGFGMKYPPQKQNFLPEKTSDYYYSFSMLPLVCNTSLKNYQAWHTHFSSFRFKKCLSKFRSGSRYWRFKRR